MHVLGQRVSTLAASAAILVASACGEEVVVRQTTRVYPDTSAYRTVEIFGRASDGELPTDPDWLADEAGLRLAEPEAWSSVESRPGYLAAEGFFPDAGALPVAIEHDSGDGASRSDRGNVRIERDDLVVLSVWRFEETLGDPHSIDELGAILDALADLAARAVRREVAREFGHEVDPAPAERFLGSEARSLVGELLVTLRTASSAAAAGKQVETLVSRYSVEAPALDGAKDPFEILEALADPILTWARAGTAEALSTARRPVTAHELRFWPDGDTLAAAMSNDDAVDPLAEELHSLGEALEKALVGFYGDPTAPRHRFETRVELPGTLVRTNGTPTGPAVTWMFRGDDLARSDVILRAESLEPAPEALRTLGARRDLSTEDLLRLLDLLTRRDPEGRLRELLSEAVERASLEPLRNDDPDDPVELAAREVVAILDPAAVRWPPPP